MRDQQIYQIRAELERKIALQNMALNKFAHESSQHMNTLVLSFNAVKNLLVEKGNMTDDEVNEQIMKEIEKAQAKPEDEIMEEPLEEIQEEETAEEETETEAEEDRDEEEQEES